MKTLSSSELYSHPGRLLEEHLINTACFAELFLSEKSISIFPTSLLLSLVRVIALSHDLGKATTFFQNYLQASPEEKKSLKTKPECHHGLYSAVCAYFLIKDMLSSHNINEELLPFFAFISIKKHHGNLIEAQVEAILDDQEQEVLLRQVDSIDDNKFSILAEHLFNSGLPYLINKDLIKSWVEEIGSELCVVRRILRKNTSQNNLSPYFFLNFIYSLLLDADKSDAAIGNTKAFYRRRVDLNENLVDNYKKSQNYSKSLVNQLRESSYQEVMRWEVDPAKKILSINLPTGLGKTLTSLSLALKIRENMQRRNNVTPRIIYCLPFLSIIEQNFRVIEDVLRSNNLQLSTDLLLKQHHLSELLYKKDDEFEFENEKAKILVEGWNSELIVTTFIQLFHTLISYRNKTSRRFHKLSNSIIILDEVQSIPFKYWLVVKDMLFKLVELFNSNVIFVTATEPLIFEKTEIFSLVDKDRYFKSLNRIIIRQQVNKDIAIEEFVSSLKIKKGKRYLFILNTINSAKLLYIKLQEKLKGKFKKEELVFLSTHVVPKERLKRIEKIKEKKIKIAVTTQLVEAGVDIDFDVVYRDLAPLDSINQASGRCNRNGEKQGEVYVISLKDESGRRYSSYIYDPILLEVTRRILSEKKEIREGDFLSLINNYYEELVEKKSKDESRELLKAITNLKYESIDGTSRDIASFRLIEEDYYKVDVFIELDDTSSSIWKKYEKVTEIVDSLQRKISFESIKSELYQYVISIPLRDQNLPPEVSGFRFVGKDDIDEYYDREIGYQVKNKVFIW